MNFGPEGAPVMVRIPPDPSLPAERQNWQAGWPLQDYLELAAVTEAVPSARYHARLIMREWRAGAFGGGMAGTGVLGAAPLARETELAEDVEQVTAEMVANAAAATQAIEWMPKQPPIRLWLLGNGDQVMVIVWDATTATPVQRWPEPGAESGRGLLLVASLARWGYYLPPPNYGGKVVHALLPRQ